MNKFLTKLTALLLGTVSVFSFAGCGTEPLPDDPDDPNGNQPVVVDSGKTQLYVGLVPSGYGNSWLRKEFQRFEAEYADYEFEPGTDKRGVQCILDDISYGNTIAQSLPAARYKIVMTQDVNYNDLVSRNLIYNLNDILNAEFTDTDETGAATVSTIKGKFLSEEAVQNYTINGGIYAIPFVCGEDGISYDRDLFLEKGFFFLANDPANDDYHAYYELDGSGKKIYTLGGRTGSGEVLSMGRDGIPGTYDDGLPATYEQFYYLMNELIDNNITPITWSGKYLNEYGRRLLYTVWANNEGYEQMRLNYTFNGTAKTLIDIDSAGNITERSDTVITNDNGYLLTHQRGKYDALDFFDNMLEILKKDSKGYNLATKDSIDHLNAQDNFLRSVVRAENQSSQYKRIAMFHDGAYWENEATSTFNAMGAGYGKKDRHIGWMPIPHPSVEGAGKTVFFGASTGMIMVNANIAETPELLDVVTKFLQFMNTRKSLVEFMQMTSMTRCMDFTMTEEEKAEMSYFGQCLYEKFKSSDIFDPMSNNPVYLRNYVTLSGGHSIVWSTAGEDLDGTDAPTVILCDKDIDAKIYFRGMQNFFTQAWWNKNVLGR